MKETGNATASILDAIQGHGPQGYQFGLDGKHTLAELSQALRELADRIDAKRIAVQRVRLSVVAVQDDFQMTHLTMKFAEGVKHEFAPENKERPEDSSADDAAAQR